MNFNSLRKEITSKNTSVKELVNDIFSKIDSKDPEINSYICTTKDNAIAQAEALARGSVDLINQNKNFLGGRPSTIISWEENTPFSIGMLIALYENITIASGFLWNINSFDQWGVELGKTIANKISNDKNDKDLTPAAKKFLNQR